MSETLYMEFDNDAIQVEYETELVETIRGARSSLGVPEEPDEQLYSYELERVELFGIDLTEHFEIDPTDDAEAFQDAIYERLTELMEELS